MANTCNTLANCSGMAWSPSMKWASDRLTTNGMVRIAMTELTAVKVTFRATSPWARWLYKLAVVPPGEAASSIKPTARAGARPNPLVIRKQISGSTSSWHTRPTSTGFGYLTTRAKSARVRDKPRPSMMMPRAMGRNAVNKGEAVMGRTRGLGGLAQVNDRSLDNPGAGAICCPG
ncbi:hypothetical protein D3C85_922600 [compost metagenome]